MWKAMGIIVFLIALGYCSYLACVSCAEIKGTNLEDAPCTPVLSNGKHNPHYGNMWMSCRQSCMDAHKSPSLNIKTCECTCR